jgi:hypothetical protein
MVGYISQASNVAVIDMTYLPWDQKKPLAYFHGALTGKAYENGEFVGRLKLLHLADKNRDLIHFGVSNRLNIVKEEDIPENFKEGNYESTHEELRRTNNFKYMITIDGNVAAWGRGS